MAVVLGWLDVAAVQGADRSACLWSACSEMMLCSREHTPFILLRWSANLARLSPSEGPHVDDARSTCTSGWAQCHWRRVWSLLRDCHWIRSVKVPGIIQQNSTANAEYHSGISQFRENIINILGYTTRVLVFLTRGNCRCYYSISLGTIFTLVSLFWLLNTDLPDSAVRIFGRRGGRLASAFRHHNAVGVRRSRTTLVTCAHRARMETLRISSNPKTVLETNCQPRWKIKDWAK